MRDWPARDDAAAGCCHACRPRRSTSGAQTWFVPGFHRDRYVRRPFACSSSGRLDRRPILRFGSTANGPLASEDRVGRLVRHLTEHDRGRDPRPGRTTGRITSDEGRGDRASAFACQRGVSRNAAQTVAPDDLRARRSSARRRPLRLGGAGVRRGGSGALLARPLRWRAAPRVALRQSRRSRERAAAREHRVRARAPCSRAAATPQVATFEVPLTRRKVGRLFAWPHGKPLARQ
jgi:hypothetical protein